MNEPQQPGIDPNALAEAMAQAFARNAPQPQQAPMSQEQIDQMLRTYRPNSDLLEQMFGENAGNESRLAALQSMIQGIVSNATAHAQVLAENYLQQYHQSINPHLEDARQLSQERFYSSLYEGAPGLKQYDPMVKQFMPQLQQDPQYPRERDKQIEFVRDKFTGLMKQANPQFEPGPAQQPQRQNNQAQQQTPTPPSLGSGASGGQAPAQPTGGGSAVPKMGFSLG